MTISDLTALLKNSLRAIGITAALTFSAVSAAQEYTVNLKDTAIQEFIKFVADVTGTTMGVDPNVKGKVRVRIGLGLGLGLGVGVGLGVGSPRLRWRGWGIGSGLGLG